MSTLTVKDKTRNAVIAEAGEFNGAFEFEGNYYFAPDHVTMDNLMVTERLYTCPYKGTCNWIDLKTDDGQVIEGVAWVYPAPKKGYERIKDHIAFYRGDRPATQTEKSSSLK